MLEVPRPDPTPVRLLPLARSVVEVVPPCTATLGSDTSGIPLLLRLDAPEVGAVLISGDKGAGKSALLRSIALSLGLHNGPDTLRLLLIDLSGPGRWGRKGGTWAGLHDLPHLLCPPLQDAHEAQLRLEWVARLIARREEQAADGEPIEGANLVVLLDGVDAALGSAAGREFAAALARIILRGREVGVQLVATTRVAAGLGRKRCWARAISWSCWAGRLAASRRRSPPAKKSSARWACWPPAPPPARKPLPRPARARSSAPRRPCRPRAIGSPNGAAWAGY
jgi:hypothetical protein